MMHGDSICSMAVPKMDDRMPRKEENQAGQASLRTPPPSSLC